MHVLRAKGVQSEREWLVVGLGTHSVVTLPLALVARTATG